MPEISRCDVWSPLRDFDDWSVQPSKGVSTRRWERRPVNQVLEEMWEMPSNEPNVVAVADRTHDVARHFYDLADKWSTETRHISSTTKMVLHPSYQTIIGMGPEVVPFLLKDLQKNRRFWFWALTHITNENPVPSADAGNIDKMIEAWVNWGRRKGFV